MIENLVIVESPAKAKTIEKFLGNRLQTYEKKLKSQHLSFYRNRIYLGVLLTAAGTADRDEVQKIF